MDSCIPAICLPDLEILRGYQSDRTATLRALLMALLEPQAMLTQYEVEDDFSSRLALQEELKSMPFSAVWEYCCLQKNVPVGMEFMKAIKDYERKELAKRT